MNQLNQFVLPCEAQGQIKWRGGQEKLRKGRVFFQRVEARHPNYLLVNTNAHTHTQTCKQTLSHAHSRTHTHTHPETSAHLHIYTSTLPHFHTSTLPHFHTSTLPQTTSAHKDINTPLRISTHQHTRTDTRTHSPHISRHTHTDILST